MRRGVDVNSSVASAYKGSNSSSSSSGRVYRSENIKRSKIEPDISGQSCSSDAQCVSFRHGDILKAQDAYKISASGHKARLGEYACIDGTCRYVVKAGELCSSAFDCAAYQLSRRWSTPSSSSTNASTSGTTSSTKNKRDLDALNAKDITDDDASQWCAPRFCTLEFTCGGAWTLPGAPISGPPGVDADKQVTNGTVSCCRGFLANAQCGLYSGAVDTCDNGFTCATSRNAEASTVRGRSELTSSHNMIVDLRQGVVDNSASHLDDGTPIGKCVSQEPHQQVWIGVLLVLIGGATLNIGLNLQKYAFRKREEKTQADAALQSSIDREKANALAQSPSAPSGIYFYSSEAVHSQSRGHDSRRCVQSDSAETTNEAGQVNENLSFSLAPAAAASDVFPLSAPSNVKRTGTGGTLLEESHMLVPLSVRNNSRMSNCGGNSANGIMEIADTTSRNRISLSAMDNVRLSYCSNQQLAQKPQTQDDQSEAKRQMWKTRLRQKIALRKNPNTPFSSPVWAVGLVIFILGNVVNFVALQFAPQSLVAPLGAVSLVTNVIVAPLLNNEKISMFDVGGIVLIIAGCVVVVVFSGIVQQNYRLCVLIQLLKSKPTVLYLCLIFGAIIAIYVFLWTVERGSARHPLMILDPYVRPIRPTSRYVKYGLPLAYASLGSFMATLTTLFAKSLVNLLSVSLFDHDNQFNHFISWVILLVTAFTAASQVYWINQGLLRYDALLQVPVFYVVWTVFDIIGGGVYFNEFKFFTTVKYVLFAIGVAVIFSGVGLLSHRMRGN
ncbi:hypothetical protein LPJ64_004600 [Coemansia asiatica]|uniref:Magnesium transporter n=1 Tax=Coemansia asiatica TaxID=1052880 RepID=A0A9W8CIF3_9FUNG|nr:hypothetical protein LPJ64_004600 [Coemansia asiatica]